MTRTTDRRSTTTSASAPSTPRLRLEPTGSRRSLLDGGWWPRSTDPVAELPGLVLAIDSIRGPVVPPGTRVESADAAMAVAASTTNRIHAQEILIPAGTALAPAPDRRPEDAWDTGDGRLRAEDLPASVLQPLAPKIVE